MCDSKFYICKHCGNLVGAINNSGVPMYCCGEPMSLLVPNTTEAAVEKHLPVVSRTEDGGIKVDVGNAAHPMQPEHFIGWVYLQTDKGGQRKCFAAGDEPTVTFALTDDKPLAAFAWCNLHGLWKSEI